MDGDAVAIVSFLGVNVISQSEVRCRVSCKVKERSLGSYQ